MLPLDTFLSAPSRFSLMSMLVGEGGLDVTLGLAYGAHPRQRMDLYVDPRRPGSGPVALFLYGGGWRTGCRGCYGYVGAALAARGIPTAIADYRLFPEVRWPAFQEDAAAAFHRAHAILGAGGNRPVAVIGHSAGAHMAALLALDRRWLDGVRPAAFVGLSGPYGFYPTQWPTTREIFAPAPDADAPRPLAHATSIAPPALLLHGSEDEVVLPHNSAELAGALQAAGSDARLMTLDGAGHKGTILGFARPLRTKFPVLDPIVRFLHGLQTARSATAATPAASASRRAD